MIHPEIKKTIELIDERISSLVKLRTTLAQEFGIESPPTLRKAESATRQLQLPEISGKFTRQQQVVAFLKEHGPKKRKDIATQLEIPTGTVAFVLNDKNTFQGLGKGLWALVEENPTL